MKSSVSPGVAAVVIVIVVLVVAVIGWKVLGKGKAADNIPAEQKAQGMNGPRGSAGASSAGRPGGMPGGAPMGTGGAPGPGSGG